MLADRGKLDSRKIRLLSNLKAFNVDCAWVEKHSAAEADCEQRDAKLQSTREQYDADAKTFNDRVRNVPVNLMLETERVGAMHLPEPTWDCYCLYRYVTRENDRTHAEVMRLPEQQRAFEALRAMDEADAALSRAREKFFTTRSPLEAAEVFILKEALAKLTTKGATAGLSTIADAEEYLDAIEKVKTVLERANVAREGFNLGREIFEWYVARDELEHATEEFGKSIVGWVKANEQTKHIPRLEQVLSQPFTVTFVYRPGGSVAIVTSSRDGVTRGITPMEAVSIDGSWDGQSTR